MGKKSEEWFKQADYDIKTADYLFKGGRYIYAVFMCHLSIEKALKGIYQNRLDKIPPKVHNLIFLIEKIVLFGSQLHGSTSVDSDIDIVIVSKDFRNKDIFERANLTMDAEIVIIKRFLIPMDIITMIPEEFKNRSSLIAEYAKSGEVLYAA